MSTSTFCGSWEKIHYGARDTNCNCKTDSILDLTTFPKIITSAIETLRTEVIFSRKEAVHWQFVASKTIIARFNIIFFFFFKEYSLKTCCLKNILKLCFRI